MVYMKNKIAIVFTVIIFLVGINLIGSASAVSEIVIGNYQNYPAYNEGIYNVEIDGNILRFGVSYGGCDDEKENFNLIWDGLYLKSNPPQVNLFLTLNDNVGNTDCERLWHNTLEFNLNKISGITKGSIINLFDSANTNAPRYKLVYEGEEGFNNTGICPEDLKTCPDGSSVGRELPNCEFPVCPSFEGCEDIGLRNDGKYCSVDKTLLSQKVSEESCNNNFECRSNVCVADNCVSPSLIERIINWFKRLFGVN